MTIRKSLLVQLEERVRIELPTDQAPVTPPDKQHSPVIFTDPDEELYVRKKPGIRFFDLGTRRNEDGTYRHITYETITTSSQQTARAFLRDQFMARILEGDVSTALALPQESAYLYTDVVFKNEEGEEVRELLAPAGVRPFVADYPNHDGTSFPPVPAPVSESNWKEGGLKFNRLGLWSIRIEGAYFYNTFDTGHFDFKVTETFDAAAPGIDFKIKSKDRVKVFLTPRMYETAETIAPGPPSVARWARMRTAPVIQNFELFAAPILDGQVIAGISNAYFYSTRALPHFWTAVSDWMISQGGPSYQHGQAWSNDDWTPAVTLTLTPVFTFAAFVAMIERNGTRFYVWRIGTSFSGGVGFGHFFPSSAATRLYNPAS